MMGEKITLWIINCKGDLTLPAIITHDTFGQEVYRKLHELIGETRDEYEAFLLGNQGPDPLFYSVLIPRLSRLTHLGHTMHDEKPNELLAAFKESLKVLSADAYPVGRAYLFGFLCHYVLDSNMHPLVFSKEFQFCDAGIEGLDRTNGSEVHAVIESEFDEMVLFTKYGKTISQFSPGNEILKARDSVLDTISKMYVYAALTVYGECIPENTFRLCVKAFRLTQSIVFHSSTGTKRAVLGRIEEVFRSYSFIRSMSPRAIKATTSQFDNSEHQPWENPFTGRTSTDGFWDIFNRAQGLAVDGIRLAGSDGFDGIRAEEITHNLDFSGAPTVAILTVEEVV